MILELLAALVGSLGYAGLFNLHGKKLVLSALGGMISWGCYRALGHFIPNSNVCALAVSALLTLYSEFLAHRLCAPATIFMAVAAIPMIPGAGLYRTAGALMQGDWPIAAELALQTLLFAASMAAGIALVLLIFKLLQAQRA